MAKIKVQFLSNHNFGLAGTRVKDAKVGEKGFSDTRMEVAAGSVHEIEESQLKALAKGEDYTTTIDETKVPGYKPKK